MIYDDMMKRMYGGNRFLRDLGMITLGAAIGSTIAFLLYAENGQDLVEDMKCSCKDTMKNLKKMGKDFMEGTMEAKEEVKSSLGIEDDNEIESYNYHSHGFSQTIAEGAQEVAKDISQAKENLEDSIEDTIDDLKPES